LERQRNHECSNTFFLPFHHIRHICVLAKYPGVDRGSPGDQSVLYPRTVSGLRNGTVTPAKT